MIRSFLLWRRTNRLPEQPTGKGAWILGAANSIAQTTPDLRFSRPSHGWLIATTVLAALVFALLIGEKF